MSLQARGVGGQSGASFPTGGRPDRNDIRDYRLQHGLQQAVRFILFLIRECPRPSHRRQSLRCILAQSAKLNRPREGVGPVTPISVECFRDVLIQRLEHPPNANAVEQCEDENGWALIAATHPVTVAAIKALP